MSIIKKALDKAEKDKSSGGKNLSPEFDAVQEENEKTECKSENIKRKNVFNNFDNPSDGIDKNQPYSKKRLKKSNKNKNETIFMLLIIVFMIASVPLFMSFEKYFNKDSFEIRKNPNEPVSVMPSKENTVNEFAHTESANAQPVNENKNKIEDEVIEKNENKNIEPKITAPKEKKEAKVNPVEVEFNNRNLPINDSMDYSDVLAMINDGNKHTAYLILKSKYVRNNSDVETLKTLAELSYNMEKYKESVEYYKKLAKLTNDRELILKVAVCYNLFLKDKEKAAKYYKEYVEKNGEQKEKVKQLLESLK